MIAVRAITPKTKFKSSIFRDEVRAAAEQIRRDVLLDYVKTVETWRHQPKFKSEVKLGGGEVQTSVTTDDEIYGYVEKGTRKHIIRPRKKGKKLYFKAGGFKPKTHVGVIQSVPGSPGKKSVFANEVVHPGTKARNFTRVIAKKWQPRYTRAIEKALERAAEKSGHRIK